MDNGQLKKLYCLSGLGVDKSVFAYLQPTDIELVHIEWIPAEKNESLEMYSQRLFDSIELPDDYNLLGVSFGGMVAIEFAKLRQPHKLLLISTLINVEDLPFMFRFAATLRLHKIVSAKLLKLPNFLTYWFFGTNTTNEKRLLKRILQQTDPAFLKWALSAIVKWKNQHKPSTVIIHGSKDRILPRAEKADHIVPEAGHFMIVTHAKEITKLISLHNS